MSEKDAIKLETKGILERLLQDRGISIYKIVIFGSFVTDKFKKDSDIDVIVISTDFRNKSIFQGETDNRYRKRIGS